MTGEHKTASADAVEIVVDGVPAREAREWLGTMLLIRSFEEACEPLALNGKIPGGVHQAVGQEGVGVGAIRALRPDDYVTGGHRGHHHAIAKGVEPRAVMAELWGRSDGCCGGRCGSMHLFDASIGYLGSNGVVGAGLGIAMGAALAASYRASGQVAVGFVGDGGANTGRTWEFVNMAAIWRLPLIVLMENNLYAVETAITRMFAGESIAARASGFGLPAVQIDGQDVFEVYRTVSAAADRARAGEGPTFVEALTYRYHGHNTEDHGHYRTDEEIEDWRRERDPIQRLREKLEAAGALAPGEFDAMTQKADEEVADAVEFAEQSPWPDGAAADSLTTIY